MALIVRQNTAEGGFAAALNAPTVTVGDWADNADGKTIAIISNGSGGTITASATVVNAPSLNDPVYGLLSKTIAAASIVAGGISILGPFPPQVYNQTVSGTPNAVTVICSAVTSVTISFVRIP